MDPRTFLPWSQDLKSSSANRQPVASTGHSLAWTVAGAGGDLISSHTGPWRGEQGECCICLGENDETSRTLSLCGHSFHLDCLRQLINSSAKTFLQCPTCKKVYGIKVGTMPTTGTISHRLLPVKLPGHEAARGCIEITFTMRGGVQARIV